MAGFQDVLKSIGFAAGAVTGGPSQVKLVSGAVAAKGKIDSYLQQFGKSIGGLVGPDLFDKIGAGAKITGDQETKKFVGENILTPSVKNKFFLLTIAIVIGGIFFLRKS